MGALWFLVVLFWTKAFYYIVQLAVPSKHNYIIFLLSAVFGRLLSARVWLPQSLDVVFVAVIFVWFGDFLRHNSALFEKYEFPAVIASFVFWIYKWQNGVYIEVGTRSYPEFIACIAEAIAGSICLIELAKALEAREIYARVLSPIGQNTLIILGVHHLDSWFSYIWNCRGGISAYFFRVIFDLAISFVIVFIKKSVIKLKRQNTVRK